VVLPYPFFKTLLSCYNESGADKKMLKARLVLAIISTSLEEVAIVVIWRWLLPEFGIRLPLAALITIMIAWAAFSVALFTFTTRTLKKQTVVGLPTMIGSKGKVASSLAPAGMVKIRGELWEATAEEGNINADAEIEVVGENGLKLIVRETGTRKTKR
jgi:membrane-bound ClpP family serine protease